MAASDELLVDTHAHIYRRDLPLAAGGLHIPKDDFELPAYLDALDRHGVRNGVIAAPSFLGTYNDYTINAIRGCQRIRATAILGPQIDPYILREMNKDGIVGVRLSFRGRAELPDITSPDYRMFLRRMADLDWHVHLHIEGQRIPQVLPGLAASPAKIVVDHFGRPDPAKGEACEGFQCLLRALDSERIWVRLSGGYRIGCDPLPLATLLLKAGGASHLVWGSDWPFTDFSDKVTYQSTIDSFREWVPGAADRAVMMRNAERLYHFV
ncbi:amidohydrolase family protein [Bradyrhizobium sp. LHD-71]|uniref:amidohydrolase family protein n=1 Tax=Bradyrhizobium sp. LHD-71 TaxID=3072141 RepID=UPI00280E7B36|nr:amidohydrolase family protein [Bradyrhizobium sp. LHD-71]MDQ8731968.1 amidohydrolase family protein [Bradyrhizobium sp. LHD-71]